MPAPRCLAGKEIAHPTERAPCDRESKDLHFEATSTQLYHPDANSTQHCLLRDRSPPWRTKGVEDLRLPFHRDRTSIRLRTSALSSTFPRSLGPLVPALPCRLQARRPQLQPPRLQRARHLQRNRRDSRCRASAQSAGRRMAACESLRRHVEGQVVGDLPGPAAQPARRAHRHEQRAAPAGVEPTWPRKTRCAPLAPIFIPRSRQAPPSAAIAFRPTVLWPRPAAPPPHGDFVIAGQASWEPDFWGRIRRTVEQARANAQASAADAANVALTLHAEMATDYFALRGWIPRSSC